MKNTKYLLDTTSFNTKYKVGTRFITDMGIKRTGVIVLPSAMPQAVMDDLMRRAYPHQPLVPVRFDDGEYNWMARQFLNLQYIRIMVNYPK